MKQQISTMLLTAIQQLQQQGVIAVANIPPIEIETTRDPQHGDFACNIAMLLAKPTGMKPRELAEKIVAQLPAAMEIKQITVAGPGFINFFMTDAAFQQVIGEILQLGKSYGRNDLGKEETVHIEFVSANPTGPLHVGHGRGAAYGATVANLLEAVGFRVHREYYVNDAGRQMDILATSIWLRYLEELGEQLVFPSNGYKGEYVIAIAKELKTQVGDAMLRPASEVMANLPPDAAANGTGDKEAHIDALIVKAKTLLGQQSYRQVFALGLDSILEDIRQDLAEFGVEYQAWFHESTLVTDGALKRSIEQLRAGGHLYEQDGALWFRATEFGDEKDRVVIRENGQPTYFAADIAYHLSKYERGFSRIIDIFGADHHGYAPRIKAFLRALGLPIDRLSVLLVQFAILYRGKEKVQMSTRGGTFVTLRELREEVGKDAARFFYIMRRPEQHLDFDLELAKSQSSDNPVYYIQYAHARVCSVFRQLAAKQWQWDQTNAMANLNLLTTDYEQALLRCLLQYPEILATAALEYQPHSLAHYLQELANYFHTYYNALPFLVEDANLRDARLALITAVRTVIANGLELLGVSAPEVM